VRRAIELYPSTPWALRLFDRIPLPAFWVGVGAALVEWLVEAAL